MQNGAIIEQGECQAIFSQPQHDYTKTLIASIPTLRLER